MALARTLAVALVGLTGHLVEVEVDLAAGLPGLHLVGLPDAALAEARDRVRAAAINSGFAWPARRITVALSPADQPKAGSGFDLAVAIGVLVAAGAVPGAAASGRTYLGELALDGRVRPVRGVLPAVQASVAAGVADVVVPGPALAEAIVVPGARVWAVDSLSALITRLRDPSGPLVDGVRQARYGDPLPPAAAVAERAAAAPDFADVLGQSDARRAAEIAAAGGHHLFLHGPPGSGKTMIAERITGLLPDLDVAAALEVTAVHSLAGELPRGGGLLRRPPYRSPHHSSSVPALVGGGSGLPRPGAASLAHRGVLFLDEAPEFAGGVLDALRQPLESGEITLARSRGFATFPARFQLVLAANPCPCARQSTNPLDCTCPPRRRRDYLGRLSGPLLDRVDLSCEVAALRPADLSGEPYGEPSAPIAARVANARASAADRFAGTAWRTNGEVPGYILRNQWPPARSGISLAREALARGHITVRGYDRVLRVAWTIADLTTGMAPGADEVGEALYFRTLPAASAA